MNIHEEAVAAPFVPVLWRPATPANEGGSSLSPGWVRVGSGLGPAEPKTPPPSGGVTDLKKKPCFRAPETSDRQCAGGTGDRN